LWGLIGIILGLAQNIDDGFETILKFSSEAMTKRVQELIIKWRKTI